MSARLTVITAITALACAGMVCAQDGAAATPDEALQRIEQLWDEGRCAQVGELAARLIEDSPNSARGWLWLGHWHQHRNEWEQAKAAYERALGLEPGLLAAHLSLPWVARELEGGEAFVEATRRVTDICADAIEADPHSRDAWFAHAICMNWLRDYASARADLRHLLELYPDDAEGLCWLSTLVLQDDPGQAVQLARRAVELEPRNVGFVLGLGAALQGADRPQEALAAYEQIKAINPDAYPHSLVASL